MKRSMILFTIKPMTFLVINITENLFYFNKIDMSY